MQTVERRRSPACRSVAISAGPIALLLVAVSVGGGPPLVAQAPGEPPPLPRPSLRAEAVEADLLWLLSSDDEEEAEEFRGDYGRGVHVRCAPTMTSTEDPAGFSWPPTPPGRVSVRAFPNPGKATLRWTYCEFRNERLPFARFRGVIWRLGDGPTLSEFLGGGFGDYADATGNLAGNVERVLQAISN